jgi:hypothetical protein
LLLADILDDACGEMIPPKKAIGPSKEKEGTLSDRIYTETVSEIFCAR